LALVVDFVLALVGLDPAVVLVVNLNGPLRCQERIERDSRTVRRQLATG
jgi:hypothetical protein